MQRFTRDGTWEDPRVLNPSRSTARWTRVAHRQGKGGHSRQTSGDLYKGVCDSIGVNL